MFEKSLRRDQENIPIGKRQHLSSQVPPQRRDIRLAENRVLQETQQNVKPNSLAFKPQRLSQEHSTISNTSGQYEKINGTHISQKGIDKEQKIPLKDATSPTSAIGVSDISYRIVNEILNAQHGNRNQLKMKAGSRMMERTKSPRVLAQTSSDNLTDAIRGVKAAFEENEELNSIDGKINDAKTKLEDKKKMLEAGRKRYEEDAQAVEEKEKILNREHNRLKGKLEKSGTKIAVKDKPILSTDKEKLKQLRGELLNYEKELSRLDKILQKQEKEKSEIEKTVNQEFEKQVEDLEEAMLSIEEQKLEIYAKLNEAILAHNEVLEQKAMLKEDLGGRLIQRADLVAQREDLEQAMDTFKQNNAAETEFYFIENQINQELGALEKALYDLYVKRDNLKKQLRNKEHKDNKSNGILNLERMKKDWFELCEIERLLSHKAEEVGLDGIDSVYSKILGQYGVHIEKNKIWEYMLDIAEQTSEEEPEDSVRIRLKGKIREEAIENWKEWESEGLSEILSKAEQTDFINLYEKFCEKIKDYDEDVAEERRVHETNDQPEEELKKVEKQIQEKEARKEELESELDKRREKLESAVISETETAFQAYLQDQAGTFETIKNKHGIEAAEDMKRQYHREFLQIAQNDLLDKLSHYRSLQDDIKYLEQTIKNNTTTVDEKVLPELQNLLPSLEEDSLLVTALKQQQIHLLETEDEVAEQLNCVVENRTEKIRLCQQNYDENQSIPPAETQEAKNSLERRIVTAKEEISKVENHMIEVDKLAIEGHSEEIRLQSELKGIDKELNELVTIKKPSLHELHIQIGVWDKELKDLEKSLEQLEMQKLGLEQQFIEQNYLNDELVHQGITPKSTMHKRSSKTLNFDLKENTSVERQPTEPTHVEKEKKDKSRMTQSLKNNMIRGLMMEMDLGSTKNASRSPLDRVSPSLPATQKNKPKRDFFDNLNILSQQELSAEKGLLNTWTCFSPPGSILLGGISQKIQEKLNDSKEKGRERKSHGHRDDLMQFRSQQKRSAQRQNTASDSIDKPNPVNIDTRTNSLPQAYNPNIRKSEEGPIFLNQNLTPKGPEILGRAPSANQTRESYNEETLQRSYMTYFDKPKNSGPTSEGLNVSSPKALNLHINSLMSQAGIQNGAQNYHSAKEPEKALSEVQLRYREFIRQSGDLPKGDLLRENFTTEELFPRHREEETEGERSKTRVLRGTKPSLVDKSLLNKTGDESGISRKIDAGSSFKNRDDSTNFLRQSRDLNDTVSKKKPHSLQEIIGEIRRGRKEMEMHKEAPKETQEDENRSKSIDVQKGKNQKAIGHTGEKLSFRDRAEGSHGKLELSETKNVHPIRMLVTPSSKTPSGLLSESKEFQELKSKINEHSIQETLFFDLIKPLLQGSFLYKKFTNAQSLKRAAFDPLMADMYPIEACGYGIRSIKLHPNLDRIEIKHTYKPGVELTLPLDRVLRAMVPQITMDVLRIQKKIVGSAQQTEEEIPELFADKRGVNNLNNGIEKYLSCSYYPFSLLLDRNGKVEFVASSYSVFKEWINGINMLLRYKKQLPQLRQKLKKTQ